MPFCPPGSGTSALTPLRRTKVSLSASVRLTTWARTHSEPLTLFLPSTLAFRVQVTSPLPTSQVP